ncbi:PatA/PatG family cyanobactin maturation protease [Spongiactinospora sp. 9N601]|uniref:PatA/PatG family cyanobactin maturation protease n=1 Tax=Spongiactinospora sp. 9N601 TaxID=3375149 RepID=UPI0037AE1358
MSAGAWRALTLSPADNQGKTHYLRKGVRMGEVSAIAGLAELWRLTTGDDRIAVAIVDGLVDMTHPVFGGANLTQLPELLPGGSTDDAASAHGTAVASVLIARHNGPVAGVAGVAPRCRAISVPVFTGRRHVSQLDLARAIDLALDAGAQVINISGGQLVDAGEAEDALSRAVRRCRESGVLVVAAAGNDGCLCDHVPAALPGVLAVGACDDAGRPLPLSNFGPISRRQGLLAPGHEIPVAVPGGGRATMSGTSLAAPIVVGVAVLLAALRLRDGGKPDLIAIGEVLRATADPCDPLIGRERRQDERASESHETDRDAACARYLTGTLNITKAVNAVTTTSTPASPPIPAIAPASISNSAVNSAAAFPAAETEFGEPGEQTAAVVPSCGPAPVMGSTVCSAADGAGCGCATEHAAASPTPVTLAAAAPTTAVPAGGRDGGVIPSAGQQPATAPRLVYALGTLGYDFGTEARRDTFKQLMPPVDVDGVPLPANPYDPRQMVDYLRDNPSEATPLIWTLNLDLTPIYAIEPVGGYGPGVYERLVEFLHRQLLADDDVEFVDRISVPGTLPGRTVRLFNGQHLPVIEINLTRGLYGWSVAGLANAVVAECDVPAHNQPGAVPERDRLQDAVADFLQRIYYDLRNFGATSRDRALNFAATNAVQARQTLAEALGKGMALKDIDTEKSPYGRPDSDCWDVKLRFFDPDNSRRAKRVYRFTIDVKDVLPVTLGPVRSWPEA